MRVSRDLYNSVLNDRDRLYKENQDLYEKMNALELEIERNKRNRIYDDMEDMIDRHEKDFHLLENQITPAIHMLNKMGFTVEKSG